MFLPRSVQKRPPSEATKTHATAPTKTTGLPPVHRAQCNTASELRRFSHTVIHQYAEVRFSTPSAPAVYDEASHEKSLTRLLQQEKKETVEGLEPQSTNRIEVASELSPTVESNSGNTFAAEAPPLVARSFQQRAPKQGEPVCIICGRYGEYICDATDEDVCSLECKAVALERAGVPREDVVAAVTAISQEALSCDWTSGSPQGEGQGAAEDEPQAPPIGWLTDQQVEALRKDLEITVKGEEVPRPILEFGHCSFSHRLQANLGKAGYAMPTPVQMQAVPAAMAGRHLMACAQTGSGKTAAFLLPVIARICELQAEGPRAQPLALVLGPTRELCTQIEAQAKALAQGLPVRTALVVGGNPLPQQVHRLQQGCQLLVATPGRLIEVLLKHEVPLEGVAVLVLDEVDAMLELGFREQVMQIVVALSQPQLLLFSATIPPAIEKFAAALLQRPVYLSVGQPGAASKAVKQTVMWVENPHKKKKLFAILTNDRHFRPPAVVFVESKQGADLLAEAVTRVTGTQAAAIHGDKPMAERRAVLQKFLVGEYPVVVATGVLGRGLDLFRVTQVILFDMPHSVAEYVHQIGRAGRLGSPGVAMVMINNDSRKLFKEFAALLRESSIVMPKELLSSPFLRDAYAVAAAGRKRKAAS